MLIASQTLFPPARIEVFNTSREKGIERVDPIFRLQADVAPLAFRQLQLGLTDVPLSRAFSDIIGESRAMKCVEEMTQLIAEYDEPVILTGETGTGKEKFARAIHKISSRCNGPIMVVHCAAIAPTLLESELFGHEKGASPAPRQSVRENWPKPTKALSSLMKLRTFLSPLRLPC